MTVSSGKKTPIKLPIKVSSDDLLISKEGIQMNSYFKPFGSNKEEALTNLLPLVNVVIDAHVEGDYEKFSSVCSKRFLSQVTKDNFDRANQHFQPQMGAIIAKTLLTAIKQRGQTVLVYVAKFSNTEDDVLIRIALCKENDEAKIDWIVIE